MTTCVAGSAVGYSKFSTTDGSCGGTESVLSTTDAACVNDGAVYIKMYCDAPAVSPAAGGSATSTAVAGVGSNSAGNFVASLGLVSAFVATSVASMMLSF